jgi:hypothetical protein
MNHRTFSGMAILRNPSYVDTARSQYVTFETDAMAS